MNEITMTVNGMPIAKKSRKVFCEALKSGDMLRKLVAKFSGRNIVARNDSKPRLRFCCKALLLRRVSSSVIAEDAMTDSRSIRSEISSNFLKMR